MFFFGKEGDGSGGMNWVENKVGGGRLWVWMCGCVEEVVFLPGSGSVWLGFSSAVQRSEGRRNAITDAPMIDYCSSVRSI